MSQDRVQEALRSYSANASAEERAELAAALLSEPPTMYRRYSRLPAWAVWVSRILALPAAGWISLTIAGETGLSPLSRWSAFGGVGVGLILATLPNYFANKIGVGYGGRPPRNRPQPPALALFAGWFFLSMLAVFARLLSDAA